MIKLITEFPIALNSPDHLMPYGTKNDANTSIELIEELITYFRKPPSVLDIGCAQGQFVKDLLDKKCFAIGLEGSDYNIKNKNINWVNLHNTNLFTCDVSEHFKITNKKFDCITAWEITEHIAPNKINTYLQNLSNHLLKTGIILISISLHNEVINGIELHQTLWSKDEWLNKLSEFFIVSNYPFKYSVREDCRKNSLFYLLQKKI